MEFERSGTTYTVRDLNCSSDERFIEELIIKKRLSYITAGIGNVAAEVISKPITPQDIQSEREKLSTLVLLFKRCMGAKPLPDSEIESMVNHNDAIIVQWWLSSMGLTSSEMDRLRKSLLVWLTPKEVDELSIKEGLELVRVRTEAARSK